VPSGFPVVKRSGDPTKRLRARELASPMIRPGLLRLRDNAGIKERIANERCSGNYF
jgi:hypothetical protein